MGLKITQMTAAGALTGVEMFEVSQPSSSVTITAATISAAAADNSYNDSGSGFVTAGFAEGDTVRVAGFTGNTANNITTGVITSITASKIVIGGTDGDVIVDDAAGESVTISKWVTRRVAASSVSPVGDHMVPVMAQAMNPRQTNGCAALAYLSGASNQPDVPYLAFDSASTEYAEFAIPMPESWNEGTVTFQPIWTHPATTTDFGVCWKLQGVAVSNDDALAATYGTAQSSVDTGGTTSDHYVGPESSAITIGGTPATGDTVYFRLARVHDDAGDTMAVDAYLIGIRLYITTATATDA
jgi:hypothetical protein